MDELENIARPAPLSELILAAGGDKSKLASLGYLIRQEIAEKSFLAAAELDLARGSANIGNDKATIHHIRMAVLFQRYISFCAEQLEISSEAAHDIRRGKKR